VTVRRVALRTTLGTPLIHYADSAGGNIRPEMNIRHQTNKFNERALRARQQGDHSLADYFEQLRDHMLSEAEQGRPRPFSHYLPQVQEEYGDHIARRTASVVLYTKPGCVQCDATHRHLTRSGVPFESVDVTQSPQALEHARSLGYSSAPVVITQNDHWSGYRPDKLNTLKTAAEWTDEDRERDLHRLMEKSHEERQQRFNNPTKIYRGLKLDLPSELEEHIKANSRMPMEPEEVGQHLSIGPKLLDHLQTAHPLRTNEYVPEPDIGLGRHWTTNKRFADIAAMQGGPYGSRHSVVLEADFPGHEHVDPEHPYVGGSWQDMSGNPMVPWKEEEEYTLKPGTPLNITGVNLNGNEVLHDPHYEKSMPQDYGIPYNGGPQIRQAGRPYTDEERELHKQQGWRGPPCEDPSHQGQLMGRCAECGRRVAPEQRAAYIDEAPWYNMAWDDDLDDDDEPVLPPKEHHGR
jgi:glutaredoxin-like protein NrdH